MTVAVDVAMNADTAHPCLRRASRTATADKDPSSQIPGDGEPRSTTPNDSEMTATMQPLRPLRRAEPVPLLGSGSYSAYAPQVRAGRTRQRSRHATGSCEVATIAVRE